MSRSDRRLAEETVIEDSKENIIVVVNREKRANAVPNEISTGLIKIKAKCKELIP
jgi:hypothetical protein